MHLIEYNEDLFSFVQSSPTSFHAIESLKKLCADSGMEELKEHEKLALWFQTDRGLDWLYDDEEERDKYPPVDEDDIAQYVLQDFVYYKAGDWSNKRIQAYLDYLYMAD